MLVVATGVTQAPNDKEQIELMLTTLKAQVGVLEAVECLIADADRCRLLQREEHSGVSGGRH